ncbi:dipeptidase [Roseomonas sp. SSH11]|uniref:Dipeptidase n=1 Tax=Pararoseomonas baculiformis TaxID=2820812 RepID=A0ABS4AJP7_9PROT|nr:dipeptidase [Pararoseomonas baculiformis]MBP0447243.1 dipeptidase [Pararoseomonas baculiformis]
MHAEIHAETLTLDTHVDIPWPETADPRGVTQRCVDFTRMKAGGLKAVVFIAYTPQGPRTPEDHAEAGARAEAMLRHIRDTAHGEGRRIVTRVAELEATHSAGATAVLLAVENGNAMGHDLSRLALWRGLGAIYLTLTHDGHNDLADAARPRRDRPEPPTLHGGLSARGRKAIEEMNRLGMLVDVSHASKASMLQAVEASRAPIVATHACCAALRTHPRNLDDEQLDALRDSGGLVQITAVPAFLRAPGPDGQYQASVEDIADHVDHAVRRIGLAHVGLSSDFDGGGGVRGWMHAGETGGLTEALHRRGYDRAAIGQLWAGNFLRVWRQAEELAAAGF